MRTKDGKGYITAKSIYPEKLRIKKKNEAFKKELAMFCIDNCPHKDKSCNSNSCKEFAQFEKLMQEKYKLNKKC